ncbi:NAD(P)H-dependent oxidoreductase [Entomomonas asaccharolytica]|uniref:NAD(P)H-dependent oxidoreductase n=1 Tax=Entomomonas asaccharolytica TaxID=2785331 RepID=A0A974RWK9_9GAMM|nr:NAD(P)H-dependent oxidoreductase [Entomomonas asaccharolytica]QQP85326.1 NAD(P)H-dependent oxidoreductase [Entomomonas asaccharolytica]
MKTLVVVTHPNIENSKINKCWLEELKKYPERFTVHELYKAYPNGVINVEKEQLLIEQHAALVLQFPVYWFNCPPLLKQWLDEVFTYGWAYGQTGDKLTNRKVALAVSAGIKEQDFSKEGRYQYTLQELLRPFEVTMKYVHADYQPLFAFYGAEYELSTQEIEQSAKNYMEFLQRIIES